jgi:hypothetical protein
MVFKTCYTSWDLDKLAPMYVLISKCKMNFKNFKLGMYIRVAQCSSRIRICTWNMDGDRGFEPYQAVRAACIAIKVFKTYHLCLTKCAF